MKIMRPRLAPRVNTYSGFTPVKSDGVNPDFTGLIQKSGLTCGEYILSMSLAKEQVDGGEEERLHYCN